MADEFIDDIDAHLNDILPEDLTLTTPTAGPPPTSPEPDSLRYFAAQNHWKSFELRHPQSVGLLGSESAEIRLSSLSAAVAAVLGSSPRWQ